MTARQVLEASAVELSKVHAPALKLYEFNYYINKAINLYVNKVYNVYDINQQTSDDLRVLKSTAYLTPTKVNKDYPTGTVGNSTMAKKYSVLASKNGATYEVYLPNDYLHMLNCVCVYQMQKQKDCWDKGSYVEVPATRLTADAWGMIMDDVYNRPSPTKPYFYIHNVNINNEVPTNPYDYSTDNQGLGTGTDFNTIPFNTIKNKISSTIKSCYLSSTTAGKDSNGYFTNKGLFLIVLVDEKGNVTADWKSDSRLSAYKVKWYDVINSTYPEDYYWQVSSTISQSSAQDILNSITKVEMNVINLSRAMQISGSSVSLVEREASHRYGNTSPVRCEIRYGKDDSVFTLVEVQIDYLKSPQQIRLTQEQLDLTEDTSLMLEYPDYVNQEIINELVHLVMEKVNDPRLSNNILMTQTIARPTGQLQAATPASLG